MFGKRMYALETGMFVKFVKRHIGLRKLQNENTIEYNY